MLNKPSTLLKPRIWPVSSDFSFPEQQVNKELGICFSGGGNRAYSATVGQLRALHRLDLLKRCAYISAVSGGAWAATPFIYANVSTAKLLGDFIEKPQDLSLEALKFHEPGYLGNAASKNLFEQFHQNWKILPADQVWMQTVGDVYLKPYLLDEARYFTENEKTFSEIIRHNPRLSPESFYLTNRRPYLITNSTLLWPHHRVALKDRLLFQVTPEYLGILNRKTLSASRFLFFKKQCDFGGGFLSSFAFNSLKPPAGINLEQSYVSIKAPKLPFSLSNMIGISSAFFASAAAKLSVVRRLIPQFYYWPIKNQGRWEMTHQAYLGDGGNLENIGLLPLLQRKVNNIVVFINSDTPINHPHKNHNGEWVGVDDYLPPLFGQYSGFWKKSEGQPSTQVFDAPVLTDLLKQFEACIRQGDSVTALTECLVKENPYFNIATYPVRILWIYNTPVKKWKERLPSALQAELEKKDNGLFPYFPNYSTFAENFNLFNLSSWGDWGKLTVEQVNLLAHFSAWNVLENKESLCSFFKR